MATADSTNNDSDDKPMTIPITSPNSSANSVLHSSPAVCLGGFVGDSVIGAFTGSIFGYGSGLIKKNGFRGSFADAGLTARNFAIMSGVHGLVLCFLRRLRQKDDVINAGVAGCCTGLVLSFPGPPQTLLQSCVMFGGFSFFIEGLNKGQQVLAHSISDRCENQPLALPLPFSLSIPLPNELKAVEGFSKRQQVLAHSRSDYSSNPPLASISPFENEDLDKRQQVLAHSRSGGFPNQPLVHPLSLSIPLPNELKAAFTFFQESSRNL